MATYRIYSLSDPRDGLARYVGRTRNPIEVRFKQHWERGGKHQTLGPWFAELQSIGMQPIKANSHEVEFRVRRDNRATAGVRRWKKSR